MRMDASTLELQLRHLPLTKQAIAGLLGTVGRTGLLGSVGRGLASVGRTAAKPLAAAGRVAGKHPVLAGAGGGTLGAGLAVDALAPSEEPLGWHRDRALGNAGIGAMARQWLTRPGKSLRSTFHGGPTPDYLIGTPDYNPWDWLKHLGSADALPRSKGPRAGGYEVDPLDPSRGRFSLGQVPTGTPPVQWRPDAGAISDPVRRAQALGVQHNLPPTSLPGLPLPGPPPLLPDRPSAGTYDVYGYGR